VRVPMLLVSIGVALTAFSPGGVLLRTPRGTAARAWVACTESSPTLLEEVCLLRGTVSTGYGRGSKKIGVPTANLPASVLEKGTVEMLDRSGGARSGALEALPRGVYVAWARLRGTVHPAVVNVGLSPTFEDAENPEPIAEAHLLDPIDADFYGEELALLLLGFVRPERKFPSFDELIAAIRADIDTAGSALGKPEFAAFRDNAALAADGAVANENEMEPDGGWGVDNLMDMMDTAEEAADDTDVGFSFMAPPEGLECSDEEECVMPEGMYDDVDYVDDE